MAKVETKAQGTVNGFKRQACLLNLKKMFCAYSEKISLVNNI